MQGTAHHQTCESWEGGARDSQYNKSSSTQQSEVSNPSDFDEISE
jgi:hypothetical protein